MYFTNYYVVWQYNSFKPTLLFQKSMEIHLFCQISSKMKGHTVICHINAEIYVRCNLGKLSYISDMITVQTTSIPISKLQYIQQVWPIMEWVERKRLLYFTTTCHKSRYIQNLVGRGTILECKARPMSDWLLHSKKG